MTAAEWLDGKIVDMNRISLQPVDMMLRELSPYACAASRRSHTFMSGRCFGGYHFHL